MSLPKQKNKFKRGFKKWADDKAIEVREELELYASSPLCAFDLCTFLNIPVLTPNEIKGLKQKDIDVLLFKGSSHWSAATVPLPNNKFIIIHNPNHSSERQQSNLMHEVAHILCGHEIPIEKQELGLSGFLRNLNEEQENEAEWLGSCLQLPRPAILWSLKNGMSVQEISDKYNASIEMVNYRINISGVKRQLSYMRR